MLILPNYIHWVCLSFYSWDWVLLQLHTIVPASQLSRYCFYTSTKTAQPMFDCGNHRKHLTACVAPHIMPCLLRALCWDHPSARLKSTGVNASDTYKLPLCALDDVWPGVRMWKQLVRTALFMLNHHRNRFNDYFHLGTKTCLAWGWSQLCLGTQVFRSTCQLVSRCLSSQVSVTDPFSVTVGWCFYHSPMKLWRAS